MKNVLIGIQARTDSSRLPNKVMKKIGNITIIDRVIGSVKKAATYVNNFSSRSLINVEYAVLVPEGDALEQHLRDRVPVVCGPENDLIARYKLAVEKYDCDYLCRVTSDCAMIPPFLISKAINTAIKGGYDFITSAHPAYRTFFDGADIEVCKRGLFDWVDENAEGADREHVFSIMADRYPDWAKQGHIFNYIDLSSLKLSIDTEKDYELVKKQLESILDKRKKWEKLHGKSSAHSF